MIIVADSGSTKCDWVLAQSNGTVIHRVQTTGINPLLVSENEIIKIIQEVGFITSNINSINEIYFYGTGCKELGAKNKMMKAMQSVIKNTKITIDEDLVGAVKAVTNVPGVVCILGTGSNCCYFDGTKIIQKQPSLGYLLADEGSGNYLGKRLIKDYFLNIMPPDLALKFKDEHSKNLDQILNELYSINYPNKYLANYARFIFNNRGHNYIEEVLYKQISKFLNTYLQPYESELSKCSVHFVGSIAYYSQDVIKKILNEMGYETGNFIKRPIDHLISNVIK